MKKFFAFAWCMLPFGAAVAEPLIIDPENYPGTNVMDGLTMPSGTYDNARIISGNGLSLGAGGLSANSLYVGQNSSGSGTGQVFVEIPAANNYTIRSDGNVSVTDLLFIASGHSLGIGPKTNGSTISSVSIGSINAVGSLAVQGVNTLNTGSIVSDSGLNFNANQMTVTGNVNSNAGDTTINITNAFAVTGDFAADGNAETEINTGSMSVGGLQNLTGDMTIVSNGAITSTGNFENMGTSMNVTGTDMVVGGTMQNGSNSGTMTLNLNSLKITGGSGTNASFVNKGNLEIIVANETNLANGFDLSTMDATNGFSLTTGTLVLNSNPDNLSQIFENNKLTLFKLVVNNGSINANNITNGSENSAANMTITTGGGINAKTIQNRGNVLNVSTIEDSDANIVLNGTDESGTSIYGAAGSTTNVVADGTLSMIGAVSNSGTMRLNGNEIELTGASNAGNLTIASQTDTTGQIHLSGGVSNSSGTTNISARQIAIDGVVETTGGTTNVRGSDAHDGASLVIGGIKATGGVTNLNALIGSMTVTGDVLTTNGAVNIGQDTYRLNVNGGTQINGDLTFSGTPATAAGNVNVAANGITRFVLTSGGLIVVNNDVIAEENDVARSGTLAANIIEIGGDISVANKGNLAFGNAGSTTMDVTGDVTATNGGTVEIYSGATTLKSLSGNGKFIMHGQSVSATTGDITVSNGIWYDGTNPSAGMIINGTDEFTLQTTTANQDVDITGGISMANQVTNPATDSDKITLNIVSANDVNVSGAVSVNGTVDETNPATSELNITASDGAVVFNNGISATTGGVINVSGLTVTTDTIDVDGNSALSLAGFNSVTTNGLVANAGDLDISGKQITMNSLKSTGGTTDVIATTTLNLGSVDVSDGIVLLQGNTINSSSLSLTGGTTKLASGNITTTGDITVSNGDLNQGGTVGVLILKNPGTLSANNLTVDGGAFVVDGNNVIYNITDTATFAGGITGNAGTATVNTDTIVVGGTISNAANLTLNTANDLTLGIIENSGNLVLNTTGGTMTATSLANTAGTTKITSNNMTLTGALTAAGKLYQNYTGALGAGDVSITPANYVLTADSVTVAGINQSASSVMTIKSSDVTVNGNVVANDLRIQANPTTNWLDVNVTGNVSGGVDFVGLEHMHIGGNYTYDNNSMLHAVVLPNPGVTIDATTYNYWSTVSLADDNTFGRITNATTDAAPLISVDGRFIYDVSSVGSELSNNPLVNPQIGIDIFDMVDSGTAIWLLHADGAGGLSELSDKIRNLYVNFCNADGTRCFKYFDSSIAENAGADQTESGLPAYLTIRDINEDGVTDSIYIVFDSRFGGPVEVFRIQPIVDRVDDHTGGEHDGAGALDEMIAGGLIDAGFYNHTPIEAIPVSFAGTNLEELATELYDRMEQYLISRDGTALARFSRLVQPREIELMAGSVALDEHTSFRDFEDHMLDEFIWNRHRSLKKAWIDVDYGVFYQNMRDNKRANGDRFSIVGGYDWQESSTLILGVAGRVSHMSGDDSEKIDLSYKPGEFVTGNVRFDVADTNIGVGAYLMKILGTKARLYGNGFLDLHLLDVSRDQTFVDHIGGSGQAFSIISEWGLLHDWLNQYIVGNLYARIGYNFGYTVKEKAAGNEYMRMKTDGYFILTPGYSLIAQKRIYPTSWFQVRPYVSAGIEYDVFGTPDYAKFKFGPAKIYTRYDIDIDPLWANIGGGVELLSATGFQVGLDYRYQYNNDLQLHKVRLSGSYRF